MRRSLLSAALVGTLLVTAACGGDDEENTSDAAEQDDNGSNGGSGDDDGGDGSVPDISIGNIPGVSDDCEELYSAYLTMFSAIGVPGANAADVGATIDRLQDAVPDELDDDAAVVAQAIGAYIEVLADYEDNAEGAFADPEVLAALEAIGSDEVTEASNNLSAYFEQECGDAGL